MLSLSSLVLLSVCSISYAADPKPPSWPEVQISWKYMDSDGATVLAQYEFYWYKSQNYRIVYGPFNYTDGGQSGFTIPMAGFANFTQQCTTRYYPDQNFFGLAKECFIEEWDRTFDYDQEFNNVKIPTSNYTYQGTKVIDGKRCNGFKFIAVNAPNPAGNIMWTQIESENPQQPPIRMDILHNGRSIVYSNFKVPALDFVINEADQFCTSISQDNDSPCKSFKKEL